MVNTKSRDNFIESNLPLVHSLCKRFIGRGIDYPLCLEGALKLKDSQSVLDGIFLAAKEIAIVDGFRLFILKTFSSS